MDRLEARVAALEAKFRRAPGQEGPECGALEYRVAESKPDAALGVLGAVRRRMLCGECGFTEEKLDT